MSLAGRRLWFVGIGGAGMSAYAQLARAWGAEVGGWDRVRTPYLDALGDVPLELGPEPAVPEGWEAVVSSAYPEVPGTSRRDFLRGLVVLRESIVVAGTHGKGTTAAMIAFALREAGRDPAWLIGAPVPQLGSNAGAGTGVLVVEGDESDGTVFSLPAAVAVVTNLELDRHSERDFASLAELEQAFDRWLATVPRVVRAAPPYRGRLALPGEHNRRNAGAALAALEQVGVDRPDAEAALARFEGVRRRFEERRVPLAGAGDVTVVDDYAHHPGEIAATIAAARERFPDATLRVLFQPHLFSRTRRFAPEFAAALAAADDVAVTDVYPARERPVPGVSGKLVVDALSDLGATPAWMPTVEDGAAWLRRRAGTGDVLLVLGAGDVDRAVDHLRG
jgi:UDP-N-acetylmuramate--alanine ligase